MIERTATLAPAITRTRKLSVEQLKNLKLPLIFQEDTIIIERSLNDWKLRKPISLNLNKVLEAQEIGLVEYIIKSCLSYQPSIIPYIFENKSLVKVARHFLRHCSGSQQSCLMYTVKLRKYAIWLGHSPDTIIQDIKPIGAIADPIKVQNHSGFLNDYLAELQDNGLKPSAVNNCIKAVKTF
jgi:hypothetical protein